jgi:hypothetical protein
MSWARVLPVIVALCVGVESPCQVVGVGLTGSLGRTAPLDRSVLDREMALGLAFVHRPFARRSTELHLEAGGSSRQLYMAGSIRWSATLSQAWRRSVGPLGVSVLPGVGIQRIETESLADRGFQAIHGRVAGRVDGPLAPGLRLFAEVAATYAYVLPAGQRSLARIANPYPPCDTGVCINAFRDAWTGTLRGGLIAAFF